MRMPIARSKVQVGRWLVAGVLIAACAGVLLGGCSGVAYPPTYTEAELKAMCERRGGWWRGQLIPGYCEYQSASLIQAP
jgi:hypothetical protein